MEYEIMNFKEIEGVFKISHLIDILKSALNEVGDIEVCAQSCGCCQHPHEIYNISVYKDGDSGSTLVLRV